MNARRAFTLIELLVVLAILGLTTAVAVPAFARLAEPDDLTDAAIEVKRVLERARLTALEGATRTTVVIDPDGPRYRLTIAAEQDSTIEAPLALSPAVKIGGTSRRPQLTFDAWGTAHGDDIVLTAAGRARIVRADPWTGRIHVENR